MNARATMPAMSQNPDGTVHLAHQPGVGLVPRAPRVLPAVIDGPVTAEALRSMADNYFGSLTKNTRRCYEGNLRLYAKFAGHGSISEAVGALVGGGPGEAFASLTRWKTALIEQGHATGSVNIAIMSVRSILTFAADCGVIPWRVRVRAMKSEQKDMRGPGREGVVKLFAATASTTPFDLRNRAMIRLLFSAALRREEVSTLDMEHVDLAAGTISVLRKGWTTRQTLSVSPNVVRDLSAWVARRGTEPGPLLWNFDPSQKSGRRLTGSGIYRILKDVAKVAGLDPTKVRPHGLRHSGITTALDATQGKIRDVMRFSGHTNPEMVLKYDDSRQDFARQVATAVDAWEGKPDHGAAISTGVDAWEGVPDDTPAPPPAPTPAPYPSAPMPESESPEVLQHREDLRWMLEASRARR